MEPELTNERAEREWAWICARVGEERAKAAISEIPGTRRPFPLNIARALGLTLPSPEQLPPARRNREVARAALAEARKRLTGR